MARISDRYIMKWSSKDEKELFSLYTLVGSNPFAPFDIEIEWRNDENHHLLVKAAPSERPVNSELVKFTKPSNDTHDDWPIPCTVVCQNFTSAQMQNMICLIAKLMAVTHWDFGKATLYLLTYYFLKELGETKYKPIISPFTSNISFPSWEPVTPDAQTVISVRGWESYLNRLWTHVALGLWPDEISFFDLALNCWDHGVLKPGCLPDRCRSLLDVAVRRSATVFNRQLRKGRQLTGSSQTTTFPTPPGANWEDVKIEIVNLNQVSVTVKSVHREFAVEKLQLFQRRLEKPILWGTLLGFASKLYLNTSDFKSNGKTKSVASVKQSMSRLRRKLKDFFGIEDDPFYRFKKSEGWRPKFEIKNAPDTEEREMSRNILTEYDDFFENIKRS